MVRDCIGEACVWAIWGEKSAHYQYRAMQIGEPQWYFEEELGKINQQQLTGKGHVRTWNYFKWKLPQ